MASWKPLREMPPSRGAIDSGHETLGDAEATRAVRSKASPGAPDPILIQGLDGRIVDLNERTARLWGLSPKELPGQPIATLQFEEQRGATGGLDLQWGSASNSARVYQENLGNTLAGTTRQTDHL